MNGKDPAVVCMETLVSPQLSVWAATTVCAKTLVSSQLSAQSPTVVYAGKKESVIEELNIIKTILEQYLCICAFMFTSTFTMNYLCLLKLS